MPRTSGRTIRSREPRAPTAAKDYTISSALTLLSELDTGVSLAVAIQLRHGEWADIVTRGLGTTLDPLNYVSADQFRKDYLASTLLSKVDFVDIPGVNKREVALAKWRECERVCAETNVRLNREGSMPEPVWLAIQRARRKISDLLGQFSSAEARSYAGFGRGGTTRVPRRSACVANKVWGQLHASSQYLVSASSCFSEVTALNSRLAATGKEPGQAIGVVPVDWNKVTTVAKSAKTDRPIASEPDLNIWAQKGIGGVIRRRLRRVGINLDSQTRNQELAKFGSETGELATVDLSSASDTVAIRIVELLLPDDWLEPLRQTRSPYGRIHHPDGTVENVLYRKWSSMGNGYTFELETLIFWGLASAVCELADAQSRQGVSVYGDDIIIPAAAYGLLAEVFTYCGFTINPEKSFATGPFRESCGKHYFLGEDVTPFYLKKRLDGPHRWFWWVNRIRYWARREVAGFHYCDRSFQIFYQKQRAFFGALVDDAGYGLGRYTVPCGKSEDAGFVSNFDEALPRFVKTRRDIKAPVYHVLEYTMLCHIRKNVTKHALDGNLTAWLFLAEEDLDRVTSDEGVNDPDEDLDPFSVNELPTTAWRYARKRGYTTQWDDIGPWF